MILKSSPMSHFEIHPENHFEFIHNQFFYIQHKFDFAQLYSCIAYLDAV